MSNNVSVADPAASAAAAARARQAAEAQRAAQAQSQAPAQPTAPAAEAPAAERAAVDPQRQGDARRVAAGRDVDAAARFDAPAAASADRLGPVRDGSHVLRVGDESPAVADLQRALNKTGASLATDGKYGPATEQAVKTFQRRAGVGADGSVGPQTMAKLDAQLAALRPPTPSTTPPSTPPATSTTPPATTPPAPSAALPRGTSDVGNLAPGELSRLRSSSDPADRRRAATIERAQSAYAHHIQQGGRVLVGTSAGNGGHPVVTLVPPGFDPTKPARVQTHYHGFNATVADGANHSSGTTRAIAAAQQADPQRIFVLPEASNARAGNYATDWSNVKSQAQTTNDALRAAGVAHVDERVVSAHSGGGAALQRAMQAQRDGSGLQADRVVLHDSLYGSEHAVAAWGRTPAGRDASATYVRGTNNAGRDAPIADAFRGRYERINVGGGNAHNRAIFEHLTGR